MSICTIPTGAKLLFGSGGSATIIAITPKNEVFKYFPIIVRPNTTKKNIMELINNFKCELYILETLTHNIIDTNKSPHIVRFKESHYCKDVPKSLFKDCSEYSKFLMQKNQASKQCNYLYRGYPKILGAGMFVCNLEFCHATLSDAISNVVKKPIADIKMFLDTVLFQITFTIEMIKQIYPLFMHNDMFIRNILLSDNHNKKGTYIRYIFKSGTRVKMFDIPANNVFIKINDFGLTQLDKKTVAKYTPSYSIEHNPKRDYFNILWDLYNGGNLGSRSFTSLTKNESKQKFLKKYFSRFINVKILDKIAQNGKKIYIDWDWNNTLDPKFSDLIELTSPQEILNYFAEIFPIDATHDISEIFGNT